MPATDLSPNPDNLRIGKGIFYFLPDGATAPAGWRDVGEVPSCTIEQTIERRPYFTQRSGIRTKLIDPVAEQSGTLRLRLDEWTGPNLAIYLLGEATGTDATSRVLIGTNASVKGGVYYRGLNDIGPKWDAWFPSVSFGPAGPVELLGDDYGGFELSGEIGTTTISGEPSLGVMSRVSPIPDANITFV